MDTKQGYICNSRPRRFGKSITADMLSAYYSKGCDSEKMFADLKIGSSENFRKHLNKYDVIHLDIQWFWSNMAKVDKIITYITESILNELREFYPESLTENVKILPEALSRIKEKTGKKIVVIIDEWDVLIREESANQQVQEEYINFLKGNFQNYWSETGTYESIVPFIGMDFDGLRTSVIEMLSGGAVNVSVTSFKNDMVGFVNQDDVLTLLIHLGYLAYNQSRQTVSIPNEEIRQEFLTAVTVDKWNEKAQTAIQQIKEKQYPASIESYTGDILLIGISYDKKSKKHQCRIERYRKDENN